MKHLINIIFAFSLALFSSSAIANIWIVDSNPGNKAKHFATLQSAHDSSVVLSGDTLYLSGSPYGYGNLTATKQLLIIGPGYFLTQNDSTQANNNDATTGQIVFQSGSAGSSITGCNITSTININADNITIERNKIIITVYIRAIFIQNVSNIKISQNYLSSSTVTETIDLQGSTNNVIIANNFINSGVYDHNMITSQSTCTNIVVEHNILFGRVSLYNSVIANNILRAGIYSGSNNTVHYNICNSTQFPAGNNNQQNVDMATVFVGTGSDDGKWKLKLGSPAIGSGTNGTDIGMFGGNNPYVLSGLPPIPTIYEFLGQSTGSNSLQVQVKIKSRR